MSLHRWVAEIARPLPARSVCLVSGCRADGKLDDGLCGKHSRLWRSSQDGVPADQREAPAAWAGQQRVRELGVHEFSLAPVAATVRWELLYALQQRDAQGHKLDPVAVRGLMTALQGVDAVATTPYAAITDRSGKAGNVRAYANMLTRIIHLRFETFRGITHTDKDVWDCLALDIETPRAGRRANLASVDFTPITQQWLREATKHWAATLRPDTSTLQRTLQACTLASAALACRPGGGHDPAELTFADMTVCFQAIQDATRADGQRYHSHYRRHLWARWHAVLDLGRSTGELAELSGTFSRQSAHTIPTEEINEDEIGKAIPETVIAQLDAHLHLLEAEHSYGRVWPKADSTLMFQTAYQVLRDTGRRPGEIVSLPLDCLETDDGEYSLIYDNHKKHRLRRRLPITADTAAIIQRWQAHHATLVLPTATKQWLFPACYESSGPGHLTTIRFATAIRRWVDAIPVLHSDLPGPDGTPLPFDRLLIYPYVFRHSYAQRHADAGVGVEVLQELMDHKDLSVTQSYYTVSLQRKREAIQVIGRYVHDRTGSPRPESASAAAYELRSVAVPFGNCIEPSNVKAGGKQCPIRFQCAGCGHYRPDPSYLPAIEEHIHALKADRETALAMDADEFVVRNLADQAAAFGHVATVMRDKLQALPESERVEVEQASVLLRKDRAGRDLPAGRTLLPLTVKESP